MVAGKKTGRTAVSGAQNKTGFIRRFHRDEGGVMLVFSIALLMMIMLIGGIGVDLMNHEMKRTRLQATLDRAVLAAADLDQTLEPEQVVQDYFNKAKMGNYLTSVNVDEGLNFRMVEATAEADVRTTLLKLAGIDSLTAPASGAAEERVEKVEISLTVDISGSMRDNNRMANLQTAARSFIDTTLRGDNNDQVSISLIPYSEHVNIGKPLFDLVDRKIKQHDYSYCLEIPDGHFAQPWLNQGYQFQQAQHYQWNFDGSNNDRTNTVCPRYAYESITAYSNNATALKNQVNQLRPRAGTSIFLGMKWATALLDPGSNNLVQGLVAQGRVDPAFAGRPSVYNDPDTLKTIVLMTDGKNDRSNRISPQYYQNSSHYSHWDRYNFWWYLNRYVSANKRHTWYHQVYDAQKGDALTNNICNAAKNAGIVIWTIGLEVDNHGANVLQNCASSPSHFFRVEGIEIRDAFQSIARQINQLRLTQ